MTSEIIVIAILAIPGIGIPLILLHQFFIRPIQMKSLAEKYGLKYTKNRKISYNTRQRNIITGTTKKREKIKIYDQVIIRRLPIPIRNNRVAERVTVVETNKSKDI